MRKKSYVSMLLAATMLVTALAGCSSGGEAASETTAAAAAEGEASADALGLPADASGKDTFTFCVTGDVPTLNQAVSLTQNNTMVLSIAGDTILDHVYENDAYDYVVNDASLAESYEWNDDQTAITIKFKEGILFQDGTELTAEDGKISVEMMQASASWPSCDFENITADGYTLTVPFKYFDVRNYDQLAAVTVFSKAAYEACNDEGEFFTSGYVSCGPYKITDWVAGDYIEFAKNEDYWRENYSPIQTVRMRFINEDAVAMMELETGGVDCVNYPAQTYIDAVKAGEYGEQFEISSCPGVYAHSLFFNTKSEYCSDIRVRKAIAYAIDRKAIYDAAFNGSGYEVWTVGTSVFEGQTVYDENTWPYPTDIEKAKELMKEAGYEDGFTLTLLGDNDNSRMLMAEMLKNQLAQININLEIEAYDNATFISVSETTEDWDFFVRRMGSTTNAPNFLQLLSEVYLKMDLTDPQWAELVDLMDKCSTTANDEERLGYIKEFEEKWWDEWLLWYPVQQMELTCLYDSRLQNFTRVQDDLNLVNIYFTE